MAPRKKNASIKSTGSTSSKAEPLPDWVKNKNVAKPPPRYLQAQQQQAQTPPASGASSNGVPSADVKPPRPPPLYPPGTKTPISLLNERVQKHYSSLGWLKPNIEARTVRRNVQDDGSEGEAYTFIVTLIKTNKADQSNPFTVRFDARDPSGLEGSSIQLPSKEEAKHFGATYALFRLCSTLSLHQVLPAGPRDYWKLLAAHKATAPAHLQWLWAPDPFEAAQKLANDKEAKKFAMQKRAEEAEKGPKLSKAWQEAKEVRMSKELRDAVEVTVKKALLVYPQESMASLEQGSSSELDETGSDTLVSALMQLGFRRGHARSACSWLKHARQGQLTSTASLASIAHLSDVDACLEYLVIFCPEEDLPPSLAPSAKADSFVVSSASADKEEVLAIRWIEDRLVKLAGYPRAAAAKCLASMIDIPLEQKEGKCVSKLLFDLCEASKMNDLSLDPCDKRAEGISSRLEEKITLAAVLGEDRIRDIPPSERPLVGSTVQHDELYDIVVAKKPDDIRLRICPDVRSRYPSKGDSTAIPCFFVVSSTLPAYLKLALTQRLGKCLLGMVEGYQDWTEMLQSGQGGILLSMVEELESCWKEIVDDPPELAQVTRGVTIQSAVRKNKLTSEHDQDKTLASSRTAKSKRPPSKLIRDATIDNSLKSARAVKLQSASYQPFKLSRASLPAANSQREILSLLKENRLLIISGETGCGKTTQCPQYILDDLIDKDQGSLCNIIVTQPRRISAMGVAARVAAERCENLDGHGEVGYAIRGERKAGRNTRLLFSTTGVLLRRLSQHDPDLQGVSHVFVDEVHERGVESDLLLLELKKVLQRNSSLRVVLMSATIDQDFFSSYFNNAPVITIPGRTFPVKDFYLEDVRFLLGNLVEEQSKVRGIDYDLIGQTTQMICDRAHKAGDKDGAILIFCPGAGEIRLAIEAIRKEVRDRVEVLPLHANLTPEEQRRVFKKMGQGTRKIVVSTNVAETSITIDDVVYVIDLGLVKETRYDPDSGLTRLVETRCSKAASRQRRGRAGRVRPGECFKLYSKNTEEYKMEAQQIPEMKRIALENLILTVKAIKGDAVNVKEYLGEAISPPEIASIDKALILLEEMSVIRGQSLTALGKHVSLLPLDVRLAKVLVLGCIFHCLDPILTIAAIMSCKPLFAGPFERREELSKARLKFQVGMSDILTDANAYQQWATMKRDRAASSEIRKWCDDNCISQSALRDIQSTRIDLLGNLSELGFVPYEYGKSDEKMSYVDVNSDDVNLKRSLLLAGLYPSIIRIAHPKAKFDQSASGTVQRESEARQVRYFDAANQRVFIHPSSTLFSINKYSSDFLTYFNKSVSKSGDLEKIYLRDATEVPIFALLLFGGKMKIHRLQGGISMSCSNDQEEGWIKLRASARIATLVQHLRFLLDAALEKSFENPTVNVFEQGLEAEIRDCLQRVLEKDGLS